MHCLVAEAKRTIATHIVWQPAPVGGQDCPTRDDSDQQKYNSIRRHEYQEGLKFQEIPKIIQNLPQSSKVCQNP